MQYYALSPLGELWAQGEAPDPAQYGEILQGLVFLYEDNDVPRLPQQIAHAINTTPDHAAKGLAYLADHKYAIEGTLSALAKREDKPLKAAKITLPKSIEEMAAVEERRIASQIKYSRSDKGKAARSKFEKGPGGKAKNQRWWSSDKGKASAHDYRLRRRQRERDAFAAQQKRLAELENV